jgi:hypothetical protein
VAAGTGSIAVSLSDMAAPPIAFLDRTLELAPLVNSNPTLSPTVSLLSGYETARMLLAQLAG